MSVMRTLIWSEWRRQRKTVLLLIVSTVILWLFMMGMVRFKLFLPEIEMTAVALVIGLPFLYCIALGGSFANEFSDKSKSFLLGLPVSKTKIYFAKYLSNLLIFLLISIVSSLLMYTLTDLTPGKAFFDDLGIWELQTAIIALLIVWILSHATIFLYNLISRNTSSGIIALLTFPIIFVIVSFATSSVTMFFFNNDQDWVTVYTLLSSIIIYLFMIGFGWYLWNKKISRELKTLKPIVFVVIILFVIPAMIYSLNYVYTKQLYDSALAEAKQSGLELDWQSKSQPAKIARASNGINDLIKFNREREKLSKITFKTLFMLLMPVNLINPALKNYVKPAQQREVANYILNNSDMQKLYLLVKKALSKPGIQYSVTYNKYNHIANWSSYREHTSAIEGAISLLLNRAYAQRYFGNNEAFFKSCNQAKKLFNSVAKMHFESNYTKSKIVNNIFRTIMLAGPESAACIDEYISALRFVEKNTAYKPYRIMSFHESRSLESHIHSTKPILALGIALSYNLRSIKKFTAKLKKSVEYRKLYLKAQKTNHLKKIVHRYRVLSQNRFYNFYAYHRYSWEINDYFRSRSKMSKDRLCLALKIYRCRYGKYPDTLQELCPEILKEIQLEPRTEKAYRYKKEKNGFVFSGGGSFLFSIRQYQPWNPQGKEKKNE